MRKVLFGKYYILNSYISITSMKIGQSFPLGSVITGAMFFVSVCNQVRTTDAPLLTCNPFNLFSMYVDVCVFGGDLVQSFF